MNDRSADPQHGHSDDGGLPEAISPASSHDTEDADREIGEGHLLLEGTAPGPAHRIGDDIREEQVPEEGANSAGRDAKTE